MKNVIIGHYNWLTMNKVEIGQMKPDAHFNFTDGDECNYMAISKESLNMFQQCSIQSTNSCTN